MAGNRRLPAWQRRAESTELVREAPRNASPREPHRIKPDKGGGNQFRAWTQKKRGRTSTLVGSDWAVAMTMPAAAPRRANSNYFGGSCGNHRSGRASAKVASWLGGATRHTLPRLSPLLGFASPRIFTPPGLAPFRTVCTCPQPEPILPNFGRNDPLINHLRIMRADGYDGERTKASLANPAARAERLPPRGVHARGRPESVKVAT